MSTATLAALVAAVLVGWVAIVAALLVLRVRLTASFPAFRFFVRLGHGLDALFAEDLPTCAHCGAEAKVLGTTSRSRWFYCDCGHHWREGATGQPAPPSSAAAS